VSFFFSFLHDGERRVGTPF